MVGGIMKVKFKPYILDIMNKCRERYTFQLDDGKSITYFKEFLKYEYFEVDDTPSSVIPLHYRITYPKNLGVFFLYKDHVMPIDFYGLDDKLFEWEE
jgi:hypothetical protein